MHLTYDNVNDAFQHIVRGFESFNRTGSSFGGQFRSTGRDAEGRVYTAGSTWAPIKRTTSRNGDCLTIQEPVIVTYRNPQFRVLFNKGRDCNPFFHLVEALWMLAGRNDVESLAYYADNIRQFSDDGKTLWGAYGHRWRPQTIPAHLTQLEECLAILKREPNTRRAVIEMWEHIDLERVHDMPNCKDVPCNLNVKFLIRMEEDEFSEQESRYLDMTVDNRSNDAVWGMLGANYVHFSFLQEYVAACLGLLVGKYHQISNNLHVYTSPKDTPPATNQMNPELWLEDVCDYYTTWEDEVVGPCPKLWIFDSPIDKVDFDKDCKQLFELLPVNHHLFNPTTRWMRKVIQPMLMAWHQHKTKSYEAALRTVQQIQAPDWKVACENWLKRRASRYHKAQADGTHANTPS